MKASQIFLEIARHHGLNAENLTVTYFRHSETCDKVTEHSSMQNGEWETLTCKECECYHRYRTK